MTTLAQIIYKETGLTESANPHEYSEVVEACHQFAILAVEAEREACAALADHAALDSHLTYEHCISVHDLNSGLVAAGAKEQAKKLSEAIRQKSK